MISRKKTPHHSARVVKRKKHRPPPSNEGKNNNRETSTHGAKFALQTSQILASLRESSLRLRHNADSRVGVSLHVLCLCASGWESRAAARFGGGGGLGFDGLVNLDCSLADFGWWTLGAAADCGAKGERAGERASKDGQYGASFSKVSPQAGAEYGNCRLQI